MLLACILVWLLYLLLTRPTCSMFEDNDLAVTSSILLHFGLVKFLPYL